MKRMTLQPAIRAFAGELPSWPQAANDTSDDDRLLVARVLAGDAAAFATLVDRHHASFLRLARACGLDGADAVRAVNDCWGKILGALATFRFDRSLRTWMLAAVAERATDTGGEWAVLRRGSFEGATRDGEPGRFDERGRWIDAPARWDERRLGVSLATAIGEAIAQLPPVQRAVLTLRDVERLAADDACAILGIAAAMETALLHAARCRVRRIVDERFRASAEWQTITG